VTVMPALTCRSTCNLNDIGETQMKSAKLFVLTLVLAISGYVYASGTDQTAAKGDKIAACTVQNCCNAKPECCAAGAACCNEGALCCSPDGSCCVKDQQCCKGGDACCVAETCPAKGQCCVREAGTKAGSKSCAVVLAKKPAAAK
jgi:hypothetical protein